MMACCCAQSSTIDFEHNGFNSHGHMLRFLGARTRFFLASDGTPREVGVVTPHLHEGVRYQYSRDLYAVGDVLLFERCFLDAPKDVSRDEPLPERVTALTSEAFRSAGYCPLHVAKHRIAWDTDTASEGDWWSGAPDPDADIMLNNVS